MSLAIRLLPETIRTIGFASIGAAYMGIGTGFANPVVIFHLQNLTDALLTFSFDGVNDHLVLPASGFILLDVSTNKSISNAMFISQGQRIYVKENGVPTSGSVYLTVFYGANAHV